jgi:hypothetical protein
MLHVSAAQGHIQATHFLSSLLHCVLCKILLLRHVGVIINSVVVGCSLIFFIVAFYVPLGVPLSWLCAMQQDAEI